MVKKIMRLKEFWPNALIGGGSAALFCLCIVRFFFPFYQGLRFVLLITTLWLLISAVCVALFFYVVRPAMKGLSVKQRFLVVTICLIFGGLMVTYWHTPLPNLVRFPFQLTITALETHNPASQGKEVQMMSFELEQQFASYGSLSGAADWQRVEQSLLAPSNRPVSLVWQGNAYQTALVFKASPRGGKVQVNWGDQIQVVDLYTPVERPFKISYVNQPLLTSFIDISIYLFIFSLLMLWLVAGFVLVWSSIPVSPALDNEGNILFHKLWWVAGVAVLAFLYLLLVTWRYGAWLHADSANYISAARHLAQGQGYIGLNTAPYDWWPPLYPAILAVFALFPSINLLEAGRWLNYVLFALSIGGAFYLTLELLQIRSKGMAVLTAVLLTVSCPLIIAYDSLLSEPLFIFSLVYFSLFFWRYLKYQRLTDALVFTLFAALSALSRYVGAVLIGVAGLAILLFIPGSWRRRLLSCVSFGLFSGMALLVWIARNYLYTHRFTGLRTPSKMPLITAVGDAFNVLAGWFLPGTIGLILFYLLIGGLWGWFIYKRRRLHELTVFDKWAWMQIVLLAAYVVNLIVSFTVMDMNVKGINDRYMSPAFLPFIWVSLYILSQWLQSGNKKSIFQKVIWGAAALCFLVQPISLAADLLRSPVHAGSYDFSIYAFERNSVINYLKQHELPHIPVYSNCARCLYVFANIHPVTIFDEAPDNRPYMPASPRDYPAILVWFNNVSPSNYDLPLPRLLPDMLQLLQHHVETRPLYESPDGGVFMLNMVP